MNPYFEDRNGHHRALYDHPYNTTALNERAVELVMVGDFLASLPAGARVLEVGNVLQHYPDLDGRTVRTIVDLFEVAPGVQNVDVFSTRGEYDAIVTISTLEHVGVDDGTGSPERGPYALSFLRSLLAPSGVLFLTFPCGHNSAFDAALAHGWLDASWSHPLRRQPNGCWFALGDETPPPYGATQPWAEAVYVGVFGPL